MPESQDEKEKRQLRELEGKNVAHYSVLLGAWIQTRMERDKSLLTLASAGIALLVTILTTVGVKRQWEIILFVFAFLGFGVSIWSTLIIYQRNSQLIESEFKKEDSTGLNLNKYDKLSFWSFIFGVAFVCLIGIVAAVEKVKNTEVNIMAKDKETKSLIEKVKESLDGLSNLRPGIVQDQGQTPSSQQDSSSTDSSLNSGEGNTKKD